ncbi:hypothetical protein ACFQ9H_05675 [Streptomyces sp. NPDC056517]|uniref:hypothetical protein n=1 Tax=Streptomyces sp. NPDC056517 TaxID=3345848 RepID=UPI003695407F
MPTASDKSRARSLYCQQLDGNPATSQLAASGNRHYQRHGTGAVFEYTGTPMFGWLTLDVNPATTQIGADGNELCQRHETSGAIFRYTGTPLTGREFLVFAGSRATRIDAGGGVMYQFRLTNGEILRHLGGTSWDTVDTDLRTLEISGGVEQMSHLRLPGRPIPVMIASSSTHLRSAR